MSSELLGDSLVLLIPEVFIVIATAFLHIFLFDIFPLLKEKKMTALRKTWIQDFLILIVITKRHAKVQDEG